MKDLFLEAEKIVSAVDSRLPARVDLQNRIDELMHAGAGRRNPQGLRWLLGSGRILDLSAQTVRAWNDIIEGVTPVNPNLDSGFGLAGEVYFDSSPRGYIACTTILNIDRNGSDYLFRLKMPKEDDATYDVSAQNHICPSMMSGVIARPEHFQAILYILNRPNLPVAR